MADEKVELDSDVRYWGREDKRHNLLGCFLPGALVLGILLSFLLMKWVALSPWVPVILVVLAVASNRYAYWIFYRKITCPHCGYNPTRRKSDGAKRKDYHKVRAQLARYAQCPECGASRDS